MKEEAKHLAEVLWENHRGKLVGTSLGLVTGIAILVFGFWNTLFVLLCGMVGLLVGVRLDKGGRLLDHLDRLFPNRFQ